MLPRLEGWVEARLGGLKAPGWLREAVLVSLAAQIATLPITLGTFGRLSLVALTHPDEDHLAGLVDVARRYRVGLVLDTRLPHTSPSALAWLTATTGSRVLLPSAGTRLDPGSGVLLQVLHPGETLLATQAADNDNSLVLRLVYGKASFLLGGDLSAEGEAYLLRQAELPLDSTVLKVAHHAAKRALSLHAPQDPLH